MSTESTARRVAIQHQVAEVADDLTAEMVFDDDGDRADKIWEATDNILTIGLEPDVEVITRVAAHCQAWLEHIAAERVERVDIDVSP